MAPSRFKTTTTPREFFHGNSRNNSGLRKPDEISRRIKMVTSESDPSGGGAGQKSEGALVKALNKAKTDLKAEIFEVSKSIFDANVEQEQEQKQDVNQERQPEQEVNQERGIDLIYQDNGSCQKVRNQEAIDVSFNK
jgi:hypothetical protein